MHITLQIFSNIFSSNLFLRTNYKIDSWTTLNGNMSLPFVAPMLITLYFLFWTHSHLALEKKSSSKAGVIQKLHWQAVGPFYNLTLTCVTLNPRSFAIFLTFLCVSVSFVRENLGQLRDSFQKRIALNLYSNLYFVD